jgi:hypothetical protein
MKRAAVIIGINKSGDLPKLKDAARGARLVENWARRQGMDPVHVFTDTNAPVEATAIWKAIKALVDAANVGQLVVYFAGHGVNRQRHEYWLLSGAPDNSNEAVNVAGSAALAFTCGIPHIVFISDACRTAAEGVRAQSITGSEIFPNREGTDAPVDQFFACQLGQPSHELKDPAITSGEFRALYTQELVPALLGRRPQVVEWSAQGDDRAGFVRMRPLRDFLASAIAARLEGSQLQTKVIQVPTAQISSDPPAWISRVAESAANSLGLSLPGAGGPIVPPESEAKAASSLLRSALAADAVKLQQALDQGRASRVTAVSEMVDATELMAQPFGRMHHETRCGFKIRGGRIVAMHARNARPEFAFDDSPAGDDIRVADVTRPGASVLLILDTGAGILLPAIPEFLATLTVKDGELVDVAYEPSENTWRWPAYQRTAKEIRALRAIAASSMMHGVFKLERDDALPIAQRMQYAKGVDPSLAVYAVHAYHDLQRTDLIREMLRYLSEDLGAPLFDVALLARALDNKTVTATSNVLSAVPLLSQGWALLSAYRVSLPPTLQRLQERLLPSLWTMLDPQGTELAHGAIDSGEIK